MKVLLTIIIASVILTSGSAWADGELHIYNWRGYTNPMLLDRFAQTYDVDITLDEYTGNEEMLAAVQAGNTGYDVVVPSDYAVQKLIEKGLLAETKPSQMENFKNVDRRWIDVSWDPGRNYSVPYHWGTTALALDTAAYAGESNTLKLLFDPPPELQGRIILVPESGVVQVALRYLGKPLCTKDADDLAALSDLLMSAKSHWRTITYDINDPMLSGEVALAYIWNGNALAVRLQKPSWTYIYPREGVVGWMDNVVVLKDAPNIENAKLFQNFLMDPEIAAINSAYNNYANAIRGSEKFLPSAFAEAPEIRLPDEAPTPEIPPACEDQITEKYNEIWAQVTK